MQDSGNNLCRKDVTQTLCQPSLATSAIANWLIANMQNRFEILRERRFQRCLNPRWLWTLSLNRSRRLRYSTNDRYISHRNPRQKVHCAYHALTMGPETCRIR